MHQIAQQLRDPGPLARFKKLIASADACIGITPEAADVYRSLRTNAKRVAFIPTPYPVGDSRWDFSRPASERRGIFVGTREFNVPSRNHLATMLLARSLSERTNERVTVFNVNGRSGEKLLAALDFPAKRLNIINRKLHYPDYLREVSRHKLVLQLDTSFVPGQVAGDALLCGLPCVGGNGAIDRLAFQDTCGIGRSIAEIGQIAERLLQDRGYYDQVIAESQKRAMEQLSFSVIAKQLEDFFGNSK